MEISDQPVVPSQQTLVQRSTSVGDRLFETEISVDEKNSIGDVSVVQVSLSRSGREMRGKKSKDNKDSIFSNGVADSAKKSKSKEEDDDDDDDDDDVEEGLIGEGQGHDFKVGDFVWAKIKSYPWWPGQIYSPGDASASAAKYKRRNRLLVACFGDKTFAWCYPFQLKPFQENFDQLVKESNSKAFSIAVEEAVNQIGRRLDVEMACGCLPLENVPVKAVVVNAGIKEGVAVPDGEIGELSINQFDPVKFLSSIKCIAQTVCIENVLELLVLKGRLSGFYCAKGYYRLPEYYEPVRIHESMKIFVRSDSIENGVASEDKGEDQMKGVDVNENGEASAVPEVGSTGVTISGRLSNITEDKMLQSKKQRSVADLMAGEKEGNVSVKPRGRPKKIKENLGSEVGKDVAEELAMSGKEPSLVEEGTISPKARGRPKKKKENIGSEGGKDVAEELFISSKEAPLHEEGTVSAKASGKPKRKRETLDLNKDSEIGNEVVEELTISGKEGSLAEEGAASSKTSGRPKKKRESLLSEVGSDVVGELINSGKEASLAEEGTMSAKPRGRPKMTKEDKDSKRGMDVTEGSAKVTGNVAEEMTISSKQAPLAEEGTMSAKPRGRPKKTGETPSSKGGTDAATETIKDVTQEMNISSKQSPLAEEVTMSAKPRGRPKKTGEMASSEGGTDVATEAIKTGSDVAQEMTISGKQSPFSDKGTMSTKPRGRPKKTREDSGSEGGAVVSTELVKVGSYVFEEITISGKQTPLTEEGTITSKPRGRPRKKTEDESEVGDDIDVVKQLPFSADSKKRKRNKDSGGGKARGKDGELSDKQAACEIRKKNVDPEFGNNSGLVVEGSVNGEQALSPNKPPNVDKDDFSAKETSSSSASLRERKKSKYLSPPYILLSQSKKNGISENDSKKKTSNISSPSAIRPPMAKCSGEVFNRDLSKESSAILKTSESLSPLQPSESNKTTTESNVSTHEILSDFRSAALDSLFLTKKQCDDDVKGFFTKFRSSVYQDGSDLTVQNNHLVGRGNRKRVSFDIKSGISDNGERESGHPISVGEPEMKKSKKKEGELSPKTSKDVGSKSHMQLSPKGNFSGNGSMAVLLITFAPGVSLPSKHELVTTFSPFGALKESETEIIEDSGCAQVVFASRSDAEEAYKNSDNISSFGSSVVSYRLRYVPVISSASENGESPHPDHHSSSLPVSVGDALCPQVSEGPPLQSVKQNLQMATSALESMWDKLPSDLKASLDSEIRGFLSKVTSMVEGSSF